MCIQLSPSHWSWNVTIDMRVVFLQFFCLIMSYRFFYFTMLVFMHTEQTNSGGNITPSPQKAAGGVKCYNKGDITTVESAPSLEEEKEEEEMKQFMLILLKMQARRCRGLVKSPRVPQQCARQPAVVHYEVIIRSGDTKSRLHLSSHNKDVNFIAGPAGHTARPGSDGSSFPPDRAPTTPLPPFSFPLSDEDKTFGPARVRRHCGVDRVTDNPRRA